MEERYCQILVDAVDCLSDPSSTRTFAHWRGDGDLDEFVAEFQTANQQINAKRHPDLLVLPKIACWALSQQAAESVEVMIDGRPELMTPLAFVSETIRARILQLKLKNPLFKAISHGVLAAISFREREYEKACQNLAFAAEKYDLAWPLTSIRTGPSFARTTVAPAHDLGRNDQASDLLRMATESGAFDQSNGLSESTYLILHRLLGQVLQSDEPKLRFPNQLKVLFVRGDQQGFILPIRVEKVEAPRPSVYLDPIDFGVTQLTKSMSDSIRIGWRCARQSSRLAVSQHEEGFPAIRIRSAMPTGLSLLRGGSAGALFAAGMIATMQEKPTDRNRSATCCLKISNDLLRQDDLVALHPKDLSFERVTGLIPKFDVTWFGAHGIDEVLVCPADLEEWRKSHPNWDQSPQVDSVDSLHQLVERLTGCLKYDRVLKRHANHVHSQWASSVLEAAREHSLDPNHNHRFDCYVAPTLMIEGPRSKVDQRDADQAAVNANSGDRERVAIPVDADAAPTDDQTPNDQHLLKLLELMLHGRRWEAAPAWLAAGRSVVIYDNAGAGKTVCTHRIRHALTSTTHRTKFFGHGAQPLVVRIEGYWPKNRQDQPLPLHSMLVAHLSSEGELPNKTDQLLEETVAYALKLRRVVLIIDGFDQFTESDRDHVINLFGIRGKHADSSDAKQCHLMVTSRVHTIDQFRATGKFFDDPSFVRVRIEPFSEDQQNRYFHRTDANGNSIGDAWLKMVADRNGMRELLGLPMVLSMLRSIFESIEREGGPMPLFASLGELSLITTRKLLARAIELNEDAVNSALEKAKIDYPHHIASGDHLEHLEHVLTLIAFQMMMMEQYDGRIEGSKAVDRFLTLCRDRYLRHANSTGDRQLTERARTTWAWALVVLQTIELNHRSVTERNTREGIAFRSRKMLECHAARYLTRYATTWDIFADEDESDLLVVEPGNRAQNLDKLCAWNYTTHPDWRETWLLAIEMPRDPVIDDPDGVYAEATIDQEVTCLSLSSLFRLPKPYPARDIRPTELMYKSWHLFEVDEQLLTERWFRVAGLPSDPDRRLARGDELESQFSHDDLVQHGERQLLGSGRSDPSANRLRLTVIERFRESSREMVAEFDRLQDKIWIDGTPQTLPADQAERKGLLDRWRQQSADVKSHTFLQCPPQSWLDRFEDGEGNDPRINPAMKNYESHRFSPFLMQATTVTRKMYSKFDRRFETSNADTDWYNSKNDEFEKISFIVNEYASGPTKRGGNDEFPIICISWYDAWTFARWLGLDFGIPDQKAWEYACRAGTVSEFHFGNGLNGLQANCNGKKPFGVDERGKQLPEGPQRLRLTAVGDSTFKCNDFGLFDTHGNVFEWCVNVTNLRGVAKGGSCFSSATSCGAGASSSKLYFQGRRSGEHGFRILRRLPNSVAPSVTSINSHDWFVFSH